MSWEQFGVEVGHGITGSQLLYSVSTGKKNPFSVAVGGCSDAQGTKISTSGKITKIMSMD